MRPQFTIRSLPTWFWFAAAGACLVLAVPSASSKVAFDLCVVLALSLTIVGGLVWLYRGSNTHK